MTERNSAVGVVNRVAEAGMIGAISRWCEFLHGKSSFETALQELCFGLNADITVLSRVLRVVPGKSSLIHFDTGRELSPAKTLNRSYARAVLGSYFDRPKTGSVWYKSMLDEDTDPALSAFHRARGLNDVAVIPLSVTEKSIDFVEVHFANQLQFEQLALLNMVADTLARTWQNRLPGLMTDCLAKNPVQLIAKDSSAPILSVENPSRLSRAEYRVCLMLSRGKSLEMLEAELNISRSTVRTHLKNIYLKTGASNKADLLYRLLTFAAPGDDQDLLGATG